MTLSSPPSLGVELSFLPPWIWACPGIALSNRIWWEVVKNLLANAGDLRGTVSIPGSGRSPGGGRSNPLQCLQNRMDRGAWRPTVHGVAKTRTRLSDTHTHTHPVYKSAGFPFLFLFSNFSEHRAFPLWLHTYKPVAPYSRFPGVELLHSGYGVWQMWVFSLTDTVTGANQFIAATSSLHMQVGRW